MFPDRERIKNILLLAGTIGFAVLGQYYFFWLRKYVWDAIIFTTIALACFVQLIRRQREQSPRKSLASWLERGRRLFVQRRPALGGLALLLNLIAARSANTQPPPGDYSGSVLLWLASLALFFTAFTVPPWSQLKNQPRPFSLSRITHHVSRVTRRELALVLLLMFIGFLLRAWDLEHIPANLSGDEGTQAMLAVDVLEGRLRNPFATGWFTVPTMSFFAQAASLRLFGDSVAGLRMLSALIGTATLLFTYLLARRNFRRRVALFGLAALTFNHYHLHFSRLGSNQIADPLFMAITLWLLTKGLRETKKPSPRAGRGATSQPTAYFLAAGLAMGLSWYGYFGSRVILLVVAVYLGTRALADGKFLRRYARPLVLMALIAFMAFSPLLLHYARYPENLSARFNQVNFFRWLENELALPQHDSLLILVMRQVWRSISAFNHTLDPTFWYRAHIPLLDFISGIFFLLGLVVAIRQWRRPAVRLVLTWFGLALLFGWILTENPPSSMRVVIIAPAVALLVALGLDRLLRVARRVLGGKRTQWTQTGLSFVIVVAVLNVHYYFAVYTPTRVYGNPSAETATVLARYLADREDEPFVYFYGPPFLYYDFGTIRFIARDVRGVNVPPKDQDPEPDTRIIDSTLFVVLSERRDELAAIQDRHPYGKIREFRSSATGRLMFVVYDVSP